MNAFRPTRLKPQLRNKTFYMNKTAHGFYDYYDLKPIEQKLNLDILINGPNNSPNKQGFSQTSPTYQNVILSKLSK